jgi:2'-5' RNA ligase
MPDEAVRKKIRAFAALKTPPDWDEQLRRAREGAEITGKGIRWVDPKQIHLTLRFFGSIEPAEVDRITDLLGRSSAGIGPITLHGEGLGCFPSVRRPRVLWVGLTGSRNELAELNRRITEATSQIGKPPEVREFKPHLTLARIENLEGRQLAGLRQFIERGLRLQSEWMVTELLLMQSHLSPQGARYELLSKVSLPR